MKGRVDRGSQRKKDASQRQEGEGPRNEGAKAVVHEDSKPTLAAGTCKVFPAKAKYVRHTSNPEDERGTAGPRDRTDNPRFV